MKERKEEITILVLGESVPEASRCIVTKPSPQFIIEHLFNLPSRRQREDDETLLNSLKKNPGITGADCIIYFDGFPPDLIDFINPLFEKDPIFFNLNTKNLGIEDCLPSIELLLQQRVDKLMFFCQASSHKDSTLACLNQDVKGHINNLYYKLLSYDNSNSFFKPAEALQAAPSVEQPKEQSKFCTIQ